MLIHKARISWRFSAEWHFFPAEDGEPHFLDTRWDPDVPDQFAFMEDPDLWRRYQKARRKAMRELEKRFNIKTLIIDYNERTGEAKLDNGDLPSDSDGG